MAPLEISVCVRSVFTPSFDRPQVLCGSAWVTTKNLKKQLIFSMSLTQSTVNSLCVLAASDESHI